MARDIEEFLRRAAERRKQQKKGGSQPASPPPRQQSPPRRRQPARRQPPPLIIDDDEVQVIRENPGMREQSVSAHVKSHINTSDIRDHASQLGGRIAEEAQIIDQQVHSHLDHDMTKLDDNASVFDEPTAEVHRSPPSAIAVEMMRMLSSPASFRQAILVHEILKRPSFDDDE